MRHFICFFIFRLTIYYYNFKGCIGFQPGAVSANFDMYNISQVDFIKPRCFPGLIEFSTPKNVYGMRVYEDKTVLTSTTKIFFHGNKTVIKFHLRNIPGTFLYKGNFLNRVNSSVIGYYYRNYFVGQIVINDEVYHMMHLEYPTQGNDIIFYNIKDVKLNSLHRDGKAVCEKMKDERFHLNKNNAHHYTNSDSLFINSHILRRNSAIKRLCSLELLVDHTYFEAKKANYTEIVSEILYHVKIADKIFSNSDIDGDGTPDGIGFNVEKITIFERNDEPGYPFVQETNDSKKFLENLSKYRHPYCMLICFTHISFWTEKYCSSGEIMKIGGICNNRLSGGYESERNVNILFLTDRERNLTIPQFKITFNLLHLLGHAFGCEDDPYNDHICSPGDFNSSDGNYIMYPRIPSGIQKNNYEFSKCCLNSMNRHRILKANCLKEPNLLSCGNYIVEERESCDCDPLSGRCSGGCCIPKGRPFQCSLKSGVECNPEIGQCCDISCKIEAKTKNKSCFSNKPCWNTTTVCNGISPFCLEIMASNGTICKNGAGICLNGKCLIKICENHNLQSCKCPLKECYICCKNSTNVCLTAKEFNISLSKYELYFRPEGTECDDKHGLCTRNGTCVKKPMFRGERMRFYLLPLPFIAFIALAIYLHVLNRDRVPSIIELVRQVERVRLVERVRHQIVK